MATSGSDSIFGLGTTRMIIAPGATLAQLVEGVAGQNALFLKYFSGGTLEIIGVGAGVTLSASDLVSASGNHYIVDSSERISIDGPTRFYLMAQSATTIVMSMRGKTAGT